MNFRDLYRLLQTLQVVPRAAGIAAQGCLEAPGKPPVETRFHELADGGIECVITQADSSDLTYDNHYNILIKIIIYERLETLDLRQLVHNGDFVLNPYGHFGKVRPLVMRAAVAYARRWFGQLVADGYLFRSADTDAREAGRACAHRS